MLRTNISRLAVLGLAAISGQAFAAVNLSGQVRLDTKFVSEPAGSNDSLDLSRVRVNVSGDVSSDWTVGIRLQAEGDSATGDSATDVQLTRAFAKWTGLENNVLTVGRAGHISSDTDDTYYTPHIAFHGSLSGFSSDDDGVSIKGSMGPVGYNLAIVQFEPASEEESLSWSYGGRANFTAMSSDKMSWGGGLGMVDLKTPTETYTVTTGDGANAANNANAVHSFKKRDGFKFDVSAVMGKMSLTGAYYDAKKKFGTTTGTAVADDIFAKDGKESSYYLEGTYLVMGDSYGFSHGTIQDPKFKSSALELGFRVSRKTLKGVSALDLNNLSASVLYTSDGAIGVAPSGTSKFETKTSAMSLFANYHVNSNAVVKVEYYDDKKEFDQNVDARARPLADPTTDPYRDTKAKHVTVRAEFNF
jgi:hypothetical protein